ncbi:solute carrier family 22 member 6-A-like isoform X2 [Macrobrachium nipponense]|uniref:solute carrier family 22 member 6-A-like isoform X2 n=1 Tax=Macrobrachium nipponense TaxID=159736 RepID=UPI0030C81D96
MARASISEPETEGGFDGMLSAIGFGRWQVIILLLPIFTMAVYPTHLLGASFLNAPLSFRCWSDEAEMFACVADGENCPNRNDLDGAAAEGAANGSSYYDSVCLTSAAEPPAGGGGGDGGGGADDGGAASLLLFNDSYGIHRTSMSSCPIVEYDTSVFQLTVMSEFDLICERSYLRPLFATLGTVGTMFGSMLGGFVGDRWGRIKAVRIGAIVNVIFVGIMVVSPNYPLILLTRFLAGGAVSACLVPAWSAALESTPNGGRALVGMLLGLPFSFLLSALAGLAYFIRNWKYLMMAGSSPVLLLVVVSFLAPESPRWLLQRGRGEEARKVLRLAVKLNRSEGKLNVDSCVDKFIKVFREEASAAASKNSENKLSVVEKFRKTLKMLFSPAMRVIIVCLGIIWILHNLLYVGVALNTNNFTDDPFLYVALTGLMDGSAVILMTPLTSCFGRRTLLMIGFLGGGVLFFLDFAVTPELEWLRWVLVMAGLFFVAGSLQVNFLYAPEVFPTEIRARGFAFVQVLGGIGSSAAPFITDVLSQTVHWGPTVVFGCSGIVGGLLFPFLPETKNQPLPDTVEEIEEIRRNKKEQKKEKKKTKSLEGIENQCYVEEGSCTHL